MRIETGARAPASGGYTTALEAPLDDPLQPFLA